MRGLIVVKRWEDLSLQQHATFVIGMLLVSVVSSLALLWSGQSNAAVSVGMVFAGGALGSLIRLRARLGASGPDA